MTALAPWLRALGALVLIGLLAACGTSSQGQPSSALGAAVARMGEPRARYALENGQRLFFVVRPGEVDSLDFDPSGQLTERRRALSQERFAALAKRGGDAASVQLEFGPPGRKLVLADGTGLQWTYSWREFDTWRLARVWFDKNSNFQRVETVDDPGADDRYR